MFFFKTYPQTKGIVLDDNNIPLDAVNILIADQKILLFSNSAVQFISESDIPNNSYIYVSKNGYHSQLFRYQNSKDFEIILERLHVDLDEVGVSESFYQLGSSR